MALLERYLTVAKEKGSSSKAAISVYAFLDYLKEQGKGSLQRALIDEFFDQNRKLKMIASENYASLAVLLSMGNWFSDKYAEGIPGARYYAGCDQADKVEAEAVEAAKQLFNAEHANVQPHSGADANLMALSALLAYKIQEPFLAAAGCKTVDELNFEQFDALRHSLVNQKILGMSLSAGGHLTHGMRANVMSRLARFTSYTVDLKTGLLDLDAIEELVAKEKPLILLAGYSAYPRKINFARLRQICDRHQALLFVDMAHFAGLVAGGAFTGEYDPVAYADIVTSTTHKTLRGPRGGLVLSKAYLKPYLDKGCPNMMGGPLIHVILAKAICFKEAATASFKEYAARVIQNAQALARGLEKEGFPVVTGGTDNHMVLFDVFSVTGLNGRQAERILSMAGITVNRNLIVGDTQGPWYTSGVRLGAPALTTRGMGPEEMEKIASMIALLLKNAKGNLKSGDAEIAEEVLDKVRRFIADLTEKYPLYPEMAFFEVAKQSDG